MEDLAVRAYSMKFFDAAIKYKGEEGAYAFFKEDISIWLLSLKSW